MHYTFTVNYYFMAENTTATAGKTPPSHEEVFNRMPANSRAGQEPAVVKSAEELAAEAKAIEDKNKAAAPPPAPIPPPPPAVVNYEDMPEDEFLKLYEKRTGKKAKSLDDLKDPPKPSTAEELQAQALKEQTEALEWAWESNKVTKELYDKSIADKSRSKREIALSLFTKELKEEDKDLTPEECEERFKDFYHEGEDETSWLFKKGVKDINAAADNYLAQYSVIDKLPEEYREVKTLAARQKAFAKQVNEIVKEVPKTLKFTYPTGEELDGKPVQFEYDIPVDDKVTAQIAKELVASGNPKMWDADPEIIRKEVEYHVFARNRDTIIPKLLADHAIKVAEEVEMRFRNARNPQQHIGGQLHTNSDKTPPSHQAVFDKMKK